MSVDALAMLFPNVAVTRGIAVRVAASYLAEQSDPSAGRWFWSYHVRIENDGEWPVQLLSRHWIIVDGNRPELHDPLQAADQRPGGTLGRRVDRLTGLRQRRYDDDGAGPGEQVRGQLHVLGRRIRADHRPTCRP